MASAELRPLSLGELLDRAFSVYRAHFWLFLGIMAIPACLLIPMNFFVMRNRLTPFPWVKAAPQTHSGAYAFAFLFIFWIIYPIVQSATTFAVADAYLGKRSTTRGAYGRIRGHFWRIMGLTVNVGIRVFGLIFILVFGAALAGVSVLVYMSRGRPTPSPVGTVVVVCLVFLAFGFALSFSLRYAVSIPVMLLEEKKGREAIRRSVELSRGRRGSMFLAILLTVVVSYAVAIMFQGPFYATVALLKVKGQLPIWLAFSLSASGSIGWAVTGSLLMIVLVLYYYDLRIRKEGFDLQFMMKSLPDSKPVDSVSPA